MSGRSGGDTVKAFSFLHRFVDRIEHIKASVGAIQEGVVNHSALVNDKLSEVIGNLVNEQQIINDKLEELIGNSVNQQRILNDKLGQLIENSVNQQRIINDKLSELIVMYGGSPRDRDEEW